jgi:5-methylcytosine-specific restriction endonuclease McrA
LTRPGSNPGLTTTTKGEEMKNRDREAVFNKYGGKCAYCGSDLHKGWHVDHLEPCRRIVHLVQVEQPEGVYPRYRWVEKFIGYANSEANHMDNYLPSCRRCNGWKSTHSLEQFRFEIAEQVKRARAYSCNFRMAEDFELVEETNKPVIFYLEKPTQGDTN